MGDDDAPTSPGVVGLGEGNPLLRDDWADSIPLTEHVRFFRETDWGATPVGELRSWGVALRLYVCMLMADSRAGCVYWWVRFLYGETGDESVVGGRKMAVA